MPREISQMDNNTMIEYIRAFIDVADAEALKVRAEQDLQAALRFVLENHIYPAARDTVSPYELIEEVDYGFGSHNAGILQQAIDKATRLRVTHDTLHYALAKIAENMLAADRATPRIMTTDATPGSTPRRRF